MFNSIVVIEENVNIRIEPRYSSEVITQLSYDIVKVLDHVKIPEAESDINWVKIEFYKQRGK